MKRMIMAFTLGLLRLVPAQAQSSSAPSLAPEQQMLKLLNAERRHAGLEPLEWNEQLAQAAQAHSRKLASHRDLSHQFPGEPELTQRVGATGARFNALAENVALAGDAEEAHLALMHSPGHRANILNPEYNAVGVAIVSLDRDMYVTEDFAHVVPSYSDEQFRQAILIAFNGIRREHKFAPAVARFDPKLDRAACSRRLDPKSVLAISPGANSATVFTAAEPDELPAPVERAAADPWLRRIGIGVCFREDPADKISKFWVVTAFYLTASQQGQGGFLQ